MNHPTLKRGDFVRLRHGPTRLRLALVLTTGPVFCRVAWYHQRARHWRNTQTIPRDSIREIMRPDDRALALPMQHLGVEQVSIILSSGERSTQ